MNSLPNQSKSSSAIFEERMRSDSRTIDDLINLALSGTNEDEMDEALFVLRYRGTWEVYEKSKELCLSESKERRELGVMILGQLGIPERSFPKKCVSFLLDLLITESDNDVLASICYALGQQVYDVRSFRYLAKMKNHSDAQVRAAVAYALGCNCSSSGPEEDHVVRDLIELSQDLDSEVRSWATFGLGTQLDLDRPDIREALYARLSDEDFETHGEAQVGLARRRDERVIDSLLQEFTNQKIGVLALEAIEELGNPSFYPLLIKVRNDRNIESDYLRSVLDDAIWSCNPSKSDDI